VVFNGVSYNLATGMNYLFSESQKSTRRRIIEICFKRKFTHIGSCLSAVDIIDVIYQIKRKEDKFILSNGHAGVALYAVLEKNKVITHETAEALNVHPDRNLKYGIEVSTGSLGQGLPISIGIALANRTRQVYCLVSDGECMEGSVAESLRIAYLAKLDNLNIIVNTNGWGGIAAIDTTYLTQFLEGFGYDAKMIDGHDFIKIKQALQTKAEGTPNLIIAETKSDQLPFLKGIDAHYYLMNAFDYQNAVRILK
jgi:transketolase